MVSPLSLTLRVLDAGGDKALPYLPGGDANPALGWRGIRFLLDHPEIFLGQLRAALRADAGLGNLRLLLPMISGPDELEQAGELLQLAIEQLRGEGIAVSRPPLGVMIEVPAAVYQIDELARQADFFCVGTNDLAQYLLATDRNNPRVSQHLNKAHPALLQVLQQIAGAARRADRTVTVCGEIAGDPAMALVLFGMGLDRLSMNPAALPRVKWSLRQVSAAWTRQLAAQALACTDPAALVRLLGTLPAHVGLPSPLAEAGPPTGHDAAGAG